MVNCAVGNNRRVRKWRVSILRIPRVVSKMQLIQMMKIERDVWVGFQTILQGRVVLSEQVMLFRFFARRLPILD
jgi:hypothetical protein